MRVAIGLALCVLASSVFAKEKAKPPALDHMRGRAATCELNYPSELKSALHAANGEPIGVYPIEGPDVARFLAVFNAVEPKTDFKAERILILSGPAFAWIEMFVDGCLDHAGKVPPADFEAMMLRAYGDEPGPDSMRL